jgi:hypothetical protein
MAASFAAVVPGIPLPSSSCIARSIALNLFAIPCLFRFHEIPPSIAFVFTTGRFNYCDGYLVLTGLAPFAPFYDSHPTPAFLKRLGSIRACLVRKESSLG